MGTTRVENGKVILSVRMSQDNFKKLSGPAANFFQGVYSGGSMSRLLDANDEQRLFTGFNLHTVALNQLDTGTISLQTLTNRWLSRAMMGTHMYPTSTMHDGTMGIEDFKSAFYRGLRSLRTGVSDNTLITALNEFRPSDVGKTKTTEQILKEIDVNKHKHGVFTSKFNEDATVLEKLLTDEGKTPEEIKEAIQKMWESGGWSDQYNRSKVELGTLTKLLKEDLRYYRLTWQETGPTSVSAPST
jgi:hypothetical protein